MHRPIRLDPAAGSLACYCPLHLSAPGKPLDPRISSKFLPYTTGSIVLTSSVVTYRGSRNVAHYNASKHGVIGLMQTLAAEYGGRGIRVNAVHPGNVGTDMLFSESTLRVFCPDLENPTIEDLRERARGRNVMDLAWVEPEDITNAVLWLASEEARYVTGVSIPVDCGLRIS